MPLKMTNYFAQDTIFGGNASFRSNQSILAHSALCCGLVKYWLTFFITHVAHIQVLKQYEIHTIPPRTKTFFQSLLQNTSRNERRIDFLYILNHCLFSKHKTKGFRELLKFIKIKYFRSLGEHNSDGRTRIFGGLTE